jgi:hypothetical protein
MRTNLLIGKGTIVPVSNVLNKNKIRNARLEFLVGLTTLRMRTDF